jgi:hypothetical protein
MWYFIDSDFPYLADSPDRLVIDEDAILEVKCPYNARDLTPFEATEKKIIKFLEISVSKLKLKINDNYMYQIQGHLHITKKEKCYFVVWTRKGLWYEEIFKNIVFWE